MENYNSYCSHARPITSIHTIPAVCERFSARAMPKHLCWRYPFFVSPRSDHQSLTHHQIQLHYTLNLQIGKGHASPSTICQIYHHTNPHHQRIVCQRHNHNPCIVSKTLSRESGKAEQEVKSSTHLSYSRYQFYSFLASPSLPCN